MNVTYASYHLHWLTEQNADDCIFRPSNIESLEQLPLPIPPELGSGYLEALGLALGMSLFRGVHNFTQNAAGKLIPLLEFNAINPETSLTVQAAHGGKFCHYDFTTEEMQFSEPGLDIFRHNSHARVKAFLDGTSDSEMITLVIGDTMLGKLLGNTSRQILLDGLGVSHTPSSKLVCIPHHITSKLREAITIQLQGTAMKLFAQCKVLEYLGALLNHVSSNKYAYQTPHKRHRIRELYDHLMKLEGKLPSLDELAHNFGTSARTLNDDFSKEYGQTIYAFITDHRLKEAHEALQRSNIPMKALAATLGYSHVNHFITAFKKKFGYPPGSLRRGITESMNEPRTPLDLFM